MPVEILFDGLPVAFARTQERPVLKRQVVGWSTQDFVQFLQDITQDLRQVFNLHGTDPAEGTAVKFRKHTDYEVERKFWPDSHFEGAYLFRDTLIVSITAPQTQGAAWTAASRWQSDNSGGPGEPLKPEPKDGHIELTIGFGDTAREPGIAGKLRFLVSSWND